MYLRIQVVKPPKVKILFILFYFTSWSATDDEQAFLGRTEEKRAFCRGGSVNDVTEVYTT